MAVEVLKPLVVYPQRGGGGGSGDGVSMSQVNAAIDAKSVSDRAYAATQATTAAAAALQKDATTVVALDPAVVDGEPIKLNDLVGIARRTGVASTEGVITTGVWPVPKDLGTTFALGTQLYWNNTTHQAGLTGDFAFGIVDKVPLSSASTVSVRLGSVSVSDTSAINNVITTAVGVGVSNAFLLTGDSRVSDESISSQRLISNAHHYFNQANCMLGARLRVAGITAVPGHKSDQFIPLGIAAMATTPCGWVLVQGGVNDFTNDYTAEQTWLGWTSGGPVGGSATSIGMRAYIDAIIASGRRALVLTEWGNTDSAANVSRVTQVVKYNRYLREYAERTPGLILLDAASIVWDQTVTTMAFMPGFMIDGTHQNLKGGYFVGYALAQLLAPYIPAGAALSSGPIETVANGGIYVTPNPTLAVTGTAGNTGAGITGAVPQNWSVIRAEGDLTQTATVTIGVSDNGLGNKVTIACTFTAKNQQIRFECHQGTGLPIPAAGDVYEGGGRVKILAGTTALKGVELTVASNLSPGGYAKAMNNDGDWSDTAPTVEMVMDYKTKPFTIPAVPGSFNFAFVARASRAGTGTFEVEMPFLRKRLT